MTLKTLKREQYSSFSAKCNNPSTNYCITFLYILMKMVRCLDGTLDKQGSEA